MDASTKFLSDVTIYSKYAKFIPELGRRETWPEIVRRNSLMHIKKWPGLSHEILQAYDLVLQKKILPSMRSLQFAGKPIEINPARIYNCSYVAADDWRVFSEVMFLLLCGTGVGYSVQYQHVDKLPEIHRTTRHKRYLVGDSIEGWSDAVRMLTKSYFTGSPRPDFDFSDIRQKGELLKTAGGRAPGPEPLENSLKKIQKLLETIPVGEKIRPLEVHDIMCHLADAVLAGGVRRCLARGTLVQTEKGFKAIEHIEIGENVLTQNGWQKVKNKFIQGEQKTINVQHQNGILCCTPNHRVAKLTGINKFEWVAASELQPNDRLAFVRAKSPGSPQTLPMKNNYTIKSTRCKNFMVPELTNDIAWLIGAIHGDGYVYLTKDRGRIYIASHSDDTQYIEKLLNCAKLLGVGCKKRKISGEKTVRVEIHSRQVAKYFYENIKKPKVELTIPVWIREAPVDIRMAYLKGIFDADGSSKTRPVGIVSVYSNYIKELQALFASCGIQTRIKKLSTKKQWKQKWGIYLINRTDKKIWADNKCGVKNVVWKDSQFCDGFPTSWIDNNVKQKSGWSNKQITYDKYQELCGDALFVPSKVISIESGDTVPTFDLEIEKSHCFIASNVLVHNSAMISLFSMDDEEMRLSKSKDWYVKNPQRARANNSAVVLRHRVRKHDFSDLWTQIHSSNAGEPGVFFTNDSSNWGTNPCCEISLRNASFCNLCEINTDNIKSEEDFEERARAAALIGTLQATYTNFHYLRDIWEKTTKKDALLGVGMTGIAGGNIRSRDLKKHAEEILEENTRFARLFKINPSARSTTVKPSGTSSLVLGCSSGVHGWHDRFYLRRLRLGKNEAIYKHIAKHCPEVVEDDHFKPQTDGIIALPVRAPDNAIFRSEPPIELLERVKYLHSNWMQPGHRSGHNTHNVSTTVSLKEDEWSTVGTWMWENRDSYNGISVFPFDGGTYVQAPHESITEREYEKRIKLVRDINLEDIREDKDNTELKESVACSGGACELSY